MLFFFKQKTAYEMRISDWSSDVCSSDLLLAIPSKQRAEVRKVLESGLTVTMGSDAAERRDHYRIYATSVRNLGTPVFPKALFDAVLEIGRASCRERVCQYV